VVFFRECIDLGHELVYIGAWGDVRLWYISHVFVNSVHVVDVGCWIAMTVFGKVANLPTVETGSFGALMLVVLLDWGVCHIVILHLGGVSIVALVLASVVRCSGTG
jgi:hypothetical protein